RSCRCPGAAKSRVVVGEATRVFAEVVGAGVDSRRAGAAVALVGAGQALGRNLRSEGDTSEVQSRYAVVCRLQLDQIDRTLLTRVCEGADRGPRLGVRSFPARRSSDLRSCRCPGAAKSRVVVGEATRVFAEVVGAGVDSRRAGAAVALVGAGQALGRNL